MFLLYYSLELLIDRLSATLNLKKITLSDFFMLKI